MNFAARPPVVLVEMNTGLARTPVDGGFVELPTGRPALTHRPPPSPPVPVPVLPPVSAPGHATAAGWSFLDGASLLPRTVAFVVEVAVDTAGFRVGGRPARPVALAGHLAAVCPREGTLLLVPSGVVTSAPAMTLLIGALADALGRPLVLAPPGVAFTATGIALGTFQRFHPRAGRSARRVETLGPALPSRGPHPLPVRREHAAPASLAPTTVPPAALAPAGPALSPAAAPPPFADPASAPTPVSPPPAFSPPAPSPFAADPPVAPVAASAVPPAAPEPAANEPAAVAVADHHDPGLHAPVRSVSVPAEAAGGTATAPTSIDPEIAALLAPRPVPAFATLTGPPPAGVPTTEPVALTRPVSAPPVPTAAPADDEDRDQKPATAALWLPEAAPADADRTAVRQALNGRYDAHARIVARRLSEDPGLRAVAGSAAGITAGLVAVRAYLLEERDTVNRVLRGASDDRAEQQHVGILARSATYGLHRLPSVFGPVFHAAAVESAAVAGYRPGDELVEPAFLDVELAPPAPGEETSVEIAIWSVSARRVGGLDVGDAAALFPPGSRFAVLAVDRPEEAPPRVLLRDLSATRRGGGDDLDRILSRLRDAPRRRGGAPGGRPPARMVPGLDDTGRRYRRPDTRAATT